MKFPGHRPGLPGNVISFQIVPLHPAHSTELAGHIPVNNPFGEPSKEGAEEELN